MCETQESINKVLTGKACSNFFDGVEPSQLKKEDVIKKISSSTKYKRYLDLMKAKVVDVLDTGARFRCYGCYHYLVKYKNEDGRVWIAEEPVEFSQGEVKESAPSPNSSTKANSSN